MTARLEFEFLNKFFRKVPKKYHTLFELPQTCCFFGVVVEFFPVRDFAESGRLFEFEVLFETMFRTFETTPSRGLSPGPGVLTRFRCLNLTKLKFNVMCSFWHSYYQMSSFSTTVTKSLAAIKLELL